MIIINKQVHVQKHLLCDISEKMRDLVEKAEEAQGKPFPQPLASKRKRDFSPPRLQIFGHIKDAAEADRALNLWTGFLHGQSMIRPQRDWRTGRYLDCRAKDEYSALVHVHTFASKYGHIDAEDASLDAIRHMLCSEVDFYHQPEWFGVTPDDSACARLLMDFLANSDYGNQFADRIDARLKRKLAKPTSERMLKETLLYDSAGLICLLRISNELCKTLVRKTEAQAAGRPPPDLTERCRYHSHESGAPCYLDERAERRVGFPDPARVEAGSHPLALPYRSKRFRHDEDED
jgi:hypothetical protein